jgi:membrane-associated phospholipid phosphatase
MPNRNARIRWLWAGSSAALLAAFVALSAAVYGNSQIWFDLRVLQPIQDDDKNGWFEPALIVLNDFNGAAELAVLLVLLVGALAWRRHWVEAALVLVGASLRLVQLGLRELIHRPQPPLPPRDYDLLLYPEKNSFPSGHVFGEWLVYGLIFAFVPLIVPWRPAVWIIRCACIVIMLAGMPARMIGAQHWPTDLIGAALLASAYVVAAWGIAWERRQAHEPAAPV